MKIVSNNWEWLINIMEKRFPNYSRVETTMVDGHIITMPRWITKDNLKDILKEADDRDKNIKWE